MFLSIKKWPKPNMSFLPYLDDYSNIWIYKSDLYKPNSNHAKTLGEIKHKTPQLRINEKQTNKFHKSGIRAFGWAFLLHPTPPKKSILLWRGQIFLTIEIYFCTLSDTFILFIIPKEIICTWLDMNHLFKIKITMPEMMLYKYRILSEYYCLLASFVVFWERERERDVYLVLCKCICLTRERINASRFSIEQERKC